MGRRRSRTWHRTNNYLRKLSRENYLSAPKIAFTSLDDFADKVGLSTSELMPYIRHEVDGYRDIDIYNPASGKTRALSVPEERLMLIQKWMLAGINTHWVHHRAGSIPHAYIRHRSILTAANMHPSTRTGFKLDIKDFFPTISSEIIKANWTSKKIASLPRHEEELVHSFIGLATRRQHTDSGDSTYLPQGAPTSGFMSNIAARGIDLAMKRVADRFGLRVTRYSDDILFTSDEIIERVSLEAALEMAQGSISKLGFEINQNKTRILTPGSRMEVLGVMLGGETPRLSRTKRRKIESEIRGIVKFGLLSHALERRRNPEALYRSLRGYLAFAYPLEKEWAQRQIALLKAAVKEL